MLSPLLIKAKKKTENVSTHLHWPFCSAKIIKITFSYWRSFRLFKREYYLHSMGQQMLNPYSATKNNALTSLTIYLNCLCLSSFLLPSSQVFRKFEKTVFHVRATSSKCLMTEGNHNTHVQFVNR